MSEEKPEAPPSPEDRLTALEARVTALEEKLSSLFRSSLKMAKMVKSLAEERGMITGSEEGGFKEDAPTVEGQKDVNDQLDWLDELELDVDDDA